ncbi:hypothetical protein [Methylomagnum ishizawai]|uniref:hypothetical protein n=1 Tax=Methylomagnum ishizawai TaxID=1760988 RepID=UPI001C33414D|nr:hypothetical protein [Methylomagnum ishizawai]BBL77384.1 hypothetical protein MishRS11D_44820 [Methylomagnum ishizawai]
MKKTCRVQTLASESGCSVDYCPGCDAFHVKVGFATLNFNPEGFAVLAATLGAALARFQGQRRREAQEGVQEGPGGGVFH